MTTLLSKLFHYVLFATSKYGIDESHGVAHSMNVLHYARKIYDSEVVKIPALKTHRNIIYTSAVLHDMCDKKYMNESVGICEIDAFLRKETELTPKEIDVSLKIMRTMSYSKVKSRGFPTDLGEYEPAYHIVRESDLLTAYDFDRSMIYHLHKNTNDIHKAFENANDLFENRVFTQRKDGLFFYNYSKVESTRLHRIALNRIKHWEKMIP
jgi:hypothetical protein